MSAIFATKMQNCADRSKFVLRPAVVKVHNEKTMLRLFEPKRHRQKQSAHSVWVLADGAQMNKQIKSALINAMIQAACD